VEVVDDSTVVGLREFCETCGVHAECVVEMVESGILRPEGATPSEWRFSTQAMIRFQRARRLQRDLEINLQGVALSLELLDDLEALRCEVGALRLRLARMSGD
jgi:chaperone modulatory protein CbpM